MVEFKLVLATKNGKSYQKDIKSPDADSLTKYRIGDTVKGDAFGFSGYVFMVTGGSDTAGFPMRKGIQSPRKKILTGKGVGFSGKKRDGKNQPGLLKRRTVCGEMITKTTRQINLQVLTEGSPRLAGEEAEGSAAGEKTLETVEEPAE
ncbi:MAG: S6e family ribosomal protein [Nanoarchaeota archaeon]|nr:S6e family ribosomal protein [Nanoarchaeota archaeon]